MGINIVDRDKLDAALTATASAIRVKTGGSGSIAFDMATDMGFKSAIDAIPTGGGGDWATPIIERTISGSYTNLSASRVGLYAFQSCVELTTVNFPACSRIYSYAFQSCVNLTTALFPVCTLIESYAFASCSSLTMLSFPVCQSIGSYAFKDCYGLTTVNFPACGEISAAAFYNCSLLATASFPACRIFRSSAFSHCFNLLSLYILGSSIPTLSNINVFVSTPISNYTTSTGGVNGSIIVQASMLDAFKTATNWSVYSSRFSVWNGID